MDNRLTTEIANTAAAHTRETPREEAWVVTADMGYGHQRAAYPFRDIAHDGVITANTGSMVDAAERKRWTTLQHLYEGASRFNEVPLVGTWL
jgi:hypothetical protein